MSTMGFITMKTPLKGEHVFLLFPKHRKSKSKFTEGSGEGWFSKRYLWFVRTYKFEMLVIPLIHDTYPARIPSPSPEKS